MNLVLIHLLAAGSVRRLLPIWLLFLHVLPGKASDPIEMRGGTYYLWEGNIDILEDREKAWTVSQVASAAFRDRFTANRVKEPYNKRRQSAWWIRFTIRGEAGADPYLLQVYSHNAERVTLYTPVENGRFDASEAGSRHPFGGKKYWYPGYTFDIRPTGVPRTYYLRFESKYRINLTSTLIPVPHFMNQQVDGYWLAGLLYGLLCTVGIYNLFWYVSSREKQYLYYVLYLAALVVYLLCLDGLAFQFLWPGHPAWNRYSVNLFSTLMVAMALVFARSFLRTAVHAPRFDRLLRGVVYLRLALGLLLLFFPALHLPLFVDLAPLACALAAGVVTYRNGCREARIYVLAFSLLLLGYLSQTGRLLQWFGENTWAWAFSGFRYGLIGESLLLTFALTDRLRIMKAEKEKVVVEKEQAREEVIRQLRENELLKNQVNRELEAKVAERTQQLLEANQEIGRMNLLLQADNTKLAFEVKDIAKARVMQKKITFEEFRQIYPDENACLKFLADLKWAQGYRCTRCGHPCHVAGKTPFSRRCRACRYDESVTVNTVFNRLRFPVEKAFYMVFLIRTGKEMTVDQLSETLDLRRQTCWDFRLKILEALKHKKPSRDLAEEWSYLVKPPKNGPDPKHP